jgi:hypothetical protein
MRIKRWPLSRLGSLIAFLAFSIVIIIRTWDFPQPQPSVRWEETHEPDRGWSSNGEIPTRLAFSPDGQILLTNNHVARLREVASGRIVAELAKAKDGDNVVLPNVALQFPKFFDDGRLLVAQVDGERMNPQVSPVSLKIWDVATGHERANFPDLGRGEWTPKYEMSGNGKALAFSLDLPPGSRTSRNRLRVWTPSDGLIAHEFLGTDSQPFALSPDGRFLIGIMWKPSMGIARWDVASGRVVGSFPVDRSPPVTNKLLFAPDGRLFVGFFGKQEPLIIDLENGRRQALPSDVTSRINAPIRFGAEGKTLVIGELRTAYESLRIFDLTSGRMINLHNAGFNAISDDGRRVSSIRSTAPPYNTGQQEQENDNDSTVIVTDQPSGKERARFMATGVRNTWFSPDGRRIAATETRNLISRPHPIWNLLPYRFSMGVDVWNQHVSYVSKLTVWDVESRRKIATVPFGDRMIQVVQTAFSADGKKLAIEYPISLKEGEPGRWAIEIWDLPENRFFWPKIGLRSALVGIALAVGWFFNEFVRRGLAIYYDSRARRNAPCRESDPE